MPAATTRSPATSPAPWARARPSIGRGLAQVQTGVGTFIAYSTQPGNVALDGVGRNSPFTAALAKGVREPGRNLTAVMIEVRREVLAATNGKQVPWDHSALTGDFYFHLASAPSMLPKTAPAPPDIESEALKQRLRQVEEELKKKSDPQQTAKLVELAQLKERVRQIEEADVPTSSASSRCTASTGRRTILPRGAAVNREVGAIQLQMARRGQEQRTLREQIAKLEEELGLAPASESKK